MWDHTVSHHGGRDQGQGDYNFRFRKSLNRQVDEAVRLGQIHNHGKVLDFSGEALSSEKYFCPRIMQYNFEN